MPRHSPTDDRQNSSRREWILRRLHWWVIPVLFVTLIGGAPACLFKKKKAAAPAAVPAGPIRIVFLPTNLGADNAELRWMSLAVPVLMTKLASVSSDLDPVPLWQLMPVAVENAGASRIINAELASYLASRMGARWAIMGEIAPSKDGLTLLVDFIPVKTAAYAFRYHKAASPSSLESNLRQAMDEFLHYQLTEPAAGKESKAALDTGLLRQIAETLDSDYGWFVAPAPGKGDAIAASLSRSDSKLARLIFSPTLYPVVGPPPPAPETTIPVPRVPPPPPEDQKPPDPGTVGPATAPTAPEPAPPPDTSQSMIAEPATEEGVEVPPPKSFTLRIERRLPSGSDAEGTSPAGGNSRGFPVSARAGPPSPPHGPSGKAGEGPNRNPAANQPTPPQSFGLQTSQASPFRIQVSSLRSRSSAEKEAGRFAKTDLATEIVEVDLGPNGTWYRVYLIGFQSRTDAVEAAKRLKAEGLIHNFLLIQ
jgi:hypothetical protein